MRPFKRVPLFLILLLFSLPVIWFAGEPAGLCQPWSEMDIRLLPDSSFAVIERQEGRKLRHCPHHDANGVLDVEQLIYVLGTIEREEWLDPAKKVEASRHLTRHYDQYLAATMKKGLHGPIDINRASLRELVTLPRVGPVLAVKIVEYRNTVSPFAAIEQIRKVEGIGAGTYNAIRYYICVR